MTSANRNDRRRRAAKLCARFVFFLALTILLPGCLPQAKLRDIRSCPPIPPILEAAGTKDRHKATLKVVADMDVQTMGKKYPLRLAIMAKRPAALRIEALPLIGPPDFLLSINGDQLRVFFPGKGEFYTGSASRHLHRFIPLSVDVRDIVSLLMGSLPSGREGDCFVQQEAEGDLRPFQILSGDGHIRSTFWLKWPELTLIRSQMSGERGKADYSAVYSNFTAIGDIAIPEKIVIRSGGGLGVRQTITIRYSDPEFDDEGDDRLFVLPVPGGLRPIELKEEPEDRD